MSRDLTERQRDCLAIIRARIESEERPPTLEEIGRALGITAQTAQVHVRHLEEKGYVERLPGSARSIRIIKKEKG